MDIMEDMKDVENTATSEKSDIACKCGSMLKDLCAIKIRNSLDLKMSVVGKSDDGSSEVEYCNKHINDSSEFSLIRTLGVVAAIGVGISLICSVCSLIKKL